MAVTFSVFIVTNENTVEFLVGEKLLPGDTLLPVHVDLHIAA